MKYLILFVLVGCSLPTPIERSFAPQSQLERASLAGYTTFNMSYKEKLSGKFKRMTGKYKLRQLKPCFYLLEESFDFEDLKTKDVKSYINTYQIALKNLAPNKVNVTTENQKRNSKLKFISGDALLYVLELEYDYKTNALMPYTSSSLNNLNVDSTKVKLVKKTMMKFRELGSANKIRRMLWNSIRDCQN